MKKKKKNRIIKFLNKIGIGTKNLPDAIKWHCASYWKLMIDKDQIHNIKYSHDLLKKHIAIPIFFSKSKKFYKDLANKLVKIS
jgi:8-amino-3,8-dideoxy-alpha-D-manno-octulosonate transaminase